MGTPHEGGSFCRASSPEVPKFGRDGTVIWAVGGWGEERMQRRQTPEATM